MALPEKTKETLSKAFEYMLSSDSDKSTMKNGVGFNKFDSEKIHEDYDKDHEITDNFIRKHARRLRNYINTQLVGAGFDAEELNKALDVVCKPQSVSSQVFEGKQAVKTGKVGRPKQPEYRKVILENIPQWMKDQKRWAVWISVPRDGKDKPDKVPLSYQINPATGAEEVKGADINNPDHYMTLEDAERLLKSNKKYKGLQFALPPISEADAAEDRVVVFDVDHSLLSDGSIKPDRQYWVDNVQTYWELSPQEGLRGFAFGKFTPEGGVHKGDFEIYQERKWATVTGQHIINTPAEIQTAQTGIDEYREQYFTPYYRVDVSTLPKTNRVFTDEEIIERLEGMPNLEMRAVFSQLFHKGYSSEDKSSDDWTLCAMIRYWTQKEEQLESIMRKSALLRPKWDEYRGDLTYLQLTIRNCLGARTADSPIYMEYTAQPLPQDVIWSELDLTVGNFRVEDNGLYHTTTDSDGNETETRISGTPFLITAKGINKDNGELNYKVLIRDGAGKDQVIWRRGPGLLKRDGVLELMNYGLEFQESDFKKINAYFFVFINTYRDELPLEFVTSCSGWKDGYTQFVIGNKIINEGGFSDIIQIGNEAVKMFDMSGSAEEWAKGVDPIIKLPQIRFKAYGTLSCLLVKFDDIDNIIFDQCCPTSRLKTFSNRLVASMFGHPKKQQLSAKSTALGVDKIAAACNDLPIFMDETSQNRAFVEEFVYRFGSSSTRVKSNVASGLEMSESYNSGLFLTGEDSVLTEDSKGGQHSRVIKETHGVPENKNGEPFFFEPELLKAVKKAMTLNCGNIVVLFVQELIPLIGNLEQMIIDNYKRLPNVGNDAQKSRLKETYAVLLTAGEIIEKVFKRLGMTACDPYEIVRSYFNENVLNGIIEPDYIKFLRPAYDMYVSDKAHFGATATSEFVENEKIDLLDKYGWIDKKGEEVVITFRSQALKDRIVKSFGGSNGGKDIAHRFETTLTQWRVHGILTPSISKKKNKETGEEEIVYKNTKQIRTASDDKQYGIQISLDQFLKHLNITDEPGEEEQPSGDIDDDGEEPEEESSTEVKETVIPSVKVPQTGSYVAPSSSNGLNQVSSVSASFDENITIHKSGDDAALYDIMADLGYTGDEQ